MTDPYEPSDADSSGENEPDRTPSDPGGGPHTQEVRHSVVSARVPEGVGRGQFSTGVVILKG
ncbi:MAG: hypothetical protein ACREJB_11465, partial [Planctomycetaceae bacterium]